MLKISKITLIALSIFIYIFPSRTYAAVYGDGIYNGGTYNNGSSPTPTTAPSSNSNSGGSSSNSSSGSNSSSSCSNQAPSSAPNLFQINATSTTAVLYFSPAGKPYNTYYVSFGNGAKDEGYGASFNQGETGGVIMYTVFQLKPNTTYTFKVRGGNGCAAGSWSKSVSARTTGSKNTVKKYYPLSLIAYSTTYTIPRTVSKIKNKLPFVAKPAPVKYLPATGSNTVVPAASKVYQAPKTSTQAIIPQPVKKSLLDKILGIFGR